MISQKPKYHLSNTEIPLDNLLLLYSFYNEIFGALRHDVGNEFALLRGVNELNNSYIDKLEEASGRLRKDKKYMEIISMMRERIRLHSDVVIRLAQKFRSYLSHFKSFEDYDPFISKPMEVMNELKKVYIHTEIRVINRSKRTLEIIFPKNVLYAIFSELITNAEKHGSKDCKVHISWKIHDKKFTCYFHDNGPGILPNTFEGFATVGDLPSFLNIDLQDSYGLSCLIRILIGAKGKLLFSHSKLLGGTLVYFDFPVYSFYWRGLKK